MPPALPIKPLVTRLCCGAGVDGVEAVVTNSFIGRLSGV
jgi:hypothetical protein